ncbi:allantoate amidohydrolase [Nocardioides marmoribigeumensis]|uniref:N-carbamoyl-L-amino-acid hydrolase n=1 Tax=Nocardioides marmoribigeumensis TaxID=433649 RepID=A0ABU2BWZ7_9ACTN|nr:allantoate amidohydrolase [Nocardioides marmoribigeumensis]MDR7362614.1 N-carbamoyl-L-amino-acid hydrolase [Nocardioides marmoribigeumensis]
MTFEQMWADLAPVGRSDATGGYLRQPFTAAEEEAQAWFAAECARRDLTVVTDAFGNHVAWWGSPTPDDRGVLTGSHLDSVRQGGAYDGPLGVVSAFAAVDLLRSRGFEPSRPIGIASFREEEGSRFPLACLGSRLATGILAWDDARELRDRDGVALADVVPGPDARPDAAGWLDHVGAFVELHVEQGRALADVDRPVGVASMIWPHGRYRLDFTGRPDHAGTTRMEDRHDPMLTYAMTVLAANKQARLSGQRATFGRVEVDPGSTNGIPGRVTGWLDARAESPEALEALVDAIARQAGDRADRDGTAVRLTAESVSGAVSFDAALARRLAEPRGWPVLPTQAGHDAGILSGAGVPTAMLFVRNPTGVSHSPEEHAPVEDCLAGVEALADVLEDLAR